MFQVLLLMAVSQFASAAVLTAPAATITPAPLVKRVVTTAGYRSTGYSDGTTEWGTVTYNLEDAIMATSSDLYRVCLIGSACDFFTCSGDYAVYPSSSTYCGTSSGLTCSYDISYTDLSDFDPKTNHWCDSSTLEGWYIYAVTTGDDDFATTDRSSTTDVSTTTTSDRTTTTRSTRTPTSTTTTSPTPIPTSATNEDPIETPKKKSTPIGAIVGGVVGGLAVIAIILALIFFMRKKKKNNAAVTNPPPPAQYQQPPPPMNYAQPAYYPQQPQQQHQPMAYNPHTSMMSAYGPEKTPGATVNANPYYINSESGPTSPVPQYSANNGAVNEMPAQRM